MKLLAQITLICILFFSCSNDQTNEKPGTVLSGLDRISEYQSLFNGKRLGIITNHTAYNRDAKFIVDLFLELPEVQVTALFGPEHGIRGKAADGVKIENENDPILNIPIYSLYSKTRKPTAEMLQDVDVLVFDIQDIGARYYTYIYTMAHAMEAAIEHDKAFVVLDRPNPLGGNIVEGNILDTTFASFVGRFPMPVRHGMTAGELARMFLAEGWLGLQSALDLTVIPMQNWRRDMWYDQTGLEFIKPSPNMPSLASATVYPGTCLIEGTTISEGRGTPIPFQLLGAPWINGVRLAAALNGLHLPGVRFKDTTFVPVSIPGAAPRPKLMNKSCNGITLKVTDRNTFRPYVAGLQVVWHIYQMYPDSLEWRSAHFNRLCGSDAMQAAIIAGQPVNELAKSWENDLQRFGEMRKKYLLY